MHNYIQNRGCILRSWGYAAQDLVYLEIEISKKEAQIYREIEKSRFISLYIYNICIYIHRNCQQEAAMNQTRKQPPNHQWAEPVRVCGVLYDLRQVYW